MESIPAAPSAGFRFPVSAIRALPAAIALLFGFVASAIADAQTRPLSDLKILYVGGSANWEKDAFNTPEEEKADVARRTASFEQMLREYFRTVAVMPASEYHQADSAAYDVTVLDGIPNPIEPRREVHDASGRITDIVAARYFTEDFSKPVVLIADMGDRLGRRVGVKFDWYCLCLDAYAHGFRSDHPIFHGPFPVKLTIEDRPTPEEAFHYEYFRDEPTPKTLPMWRVQTKGYQSDRNFRIGMVARPWGFEDSPDAEYISSGVCQKGLDAVAIGRHGNFFGWGFAASPEFMTEEGKTVFANAICYIAKFDGQGLIARKYNDRRATKDWIRELKYTSTREFYDSYRELIENHNKRMAATKIEAEARKARGEKLTMLEDISLRYRPSPIESYEDGLKKRFKDLYARFGTDSAAYQRYYDENYDYFYSEPVSYKITVDEDAKSLGIPNTDPRILEAAISLWEKGGDAAKAKRILTRYTLLDFETPAEWRAWFDANRSRLFFTQSGGWVFMVNSRDPAVVGNDYARKARNRAVASIQPEETDNLNPVSVAAGVVDQDGGRKEIVVRFRIQPGYHIYSHVAPGAAFTPTTLQISLPSGFKPAGELQVPPFQPFNEEGTTGILTDTVTYTQEITGTGAGEATVAISYQCCDDHICFPPAEREIRIRI